MCPVSIVTGVEKVALAAQAQGFGDMPRKKEASPFWVSLLVRNRLQELFLASLVSLVEHINSAGAVDDLHLAGVERVRCV